MVRAGQAAAVARTLPAVRAAVAVARTLPAVRSAAVARRHPGAPSARVGTVLAEEAVLVLAAPMLGAPPAVLVPAEPCPRMAEWEAWADWQGRQVKAEPPHKLEAHQGPAELGPRMAEREAWADWQGRQVKAEPPHKLEAHQGPAEQCPPLDQVESRARGESPRRAATQATRLVDRVEPRRRALARVAVVAPSGASQSNGTNCCLLFSLRWDFWRAGGSALAVPMGL